MSTSSINESTWRESGKADFVCWIDDLSLTELLAEADCHSCFSHPGRDTFEDDMEKTLVSWWNPNSRKQLRYRRGRPDAVEARRESHGSSYYGIHIPMHLNFGQG
jgi:hypothetical protein